MDYLYAVILGIVQGVAEFLPVSSSGHLVIVGALLREFLSVDVDGAADNTLMNVSLHFGTLLSIVVVYREELLRLLKNPRLMSCIVIATIPVGVVGLTFRGPLKSLFENPLAAGCCLLVTGLVLATAKRLQKHRLNLDELGWGKSFLLGLAQACAILPGISRSGSTIAAGLLTGLDRTSAARFSFLIAIPAIGGAALVEGKDLLTGEAEVTTGLGPVAAGTLVAFVVGVLSLRWLIRLVEENRITGFAVYCGAAGILTIVWQLLATAG